MSKGLLADYFERKYLDYQRDHGRMSLTKFAAELHISKGFLSQIMAGRAVAMKYQTAVVIADVLGDDELLEILGYERKPDPFPPALRSALESARVKIIEAGVSGDSPEAESIIISAMNAAGYTLIPTSKDESENSSTATPFR